MYCRTIKTKILSTSRVFKLLMPLAHALSASIGGRGGARRIMCVCPVIEGDSAFSHVVILSLDTALDQKTAR